VWTENVHTIVAVALLADEQESVPCAVVSFVHAKAGAARAATMSPVNTSMNAILRRRILRRRIGPSPFPHSGGIPSVGLRDCRLRG
jgi:hypothetical protein